MKRILLLSAICFATLGATTTQAQHFHSHGRITTNRYSSPNYGGYGFGGGWGYGSYGCQPHYGGYYHDTSHYDYHPPTAYRHGNHYHVQPGHYDWHQSGHWHR